MRIRAAMVACVVTAGLVAGCSGTASPGSSPNRVVPATAASTTEPTVTPVTTSSAATNPEPTAMPSALATPNATTDAGPTPGWTCSSPVTVSALQMDSAWPLDKLLACFGSGDHQVIGYLAPASGIGGLGNGVVPSWLGEWAGLDDVLWLKPHPADGCVAATDCVWTFLFASHPSALPLAPDRWVTVTGHFDDPAARTCRATGSGPDAVTSDVQAVITCRRHFVVTEIRTAPPPAS